MAIVTIVGSGPSGVHFALSVLKKGHRVIMLDVGETTSSNISVQHSFSQLKVELPDPVEYFLGKDYEAVIYPGTKGEYYGFPPSKRFVFTAPPQHRVESKGFSPLLSFARGGLAEAWTGGVYPFNEEEMRPFPFSYTEMRSSYDEIARRIGVSGVQDDLAAVMPMHSYLQEPLSLDQHSQNLLEKYQKRRDWFKEHLNCVMGRARMAVLSQDLDNRHACNYRGRCLWGCPRGSFYTPSFTLQECSRYASFQYLPGHFVCHFEADRDGRISHVVAESLKTNTIKKFDVDTLVLAAGALSTSRIFLESWRRHTGAIIRLTGLMDNQQIFIPFVNRDLIGKPYQDESYQYHQIAFGILGDSPERYLHGLITTLKTALVHPLIQRTPTDLRFAVFMFKYLHAALGLVNLNLSNTRRVENYVTLGHHRQGEVSDLQIQYEPASNHARRVEAATQEVKRVLRHLKCIVPPGQVHVRPMGASVHYSGTLPMSSEKEPLTVSPNCQSHDFENLYIVDGSTFPVLPAKNLTFTLMANAARVAQNAF